MVKTMKHADVVIIGLGWTGSIMAIELAHAGLNVVALERGKYRDTSPDYTYPKAVDELKYGVRGDLFRRLSLETVTLRYDSNSTALPYRQYGAFLLPDNVGGAGVHWNGQLYRPSPEDLKLHTRIKERYGANFMPEDMTIQDYDVTYDELEPYLDKFEKLNGASGVAGNLRGQPLAGGNPFEGYRSSPYPTPPVPNTYPAALFGKAASEVGFHPYPQPCANCSEPYTNFYGVRLGPCNLCGFCERFGCYLYSKGSPQTTVLPALMRLPNFEMRTQSWVQRINVDSTGKKATGVTYIDAAGAEVFQPADMVILASFQHNNVRTMLLSKIGKPYDPRTGEGVIGKNFAYQMFNYNTLFLDPAVFTNPFIGAGAGGSMIVDDFNSDHFDHSKLGFVGGAYILGGQTGARPIQQLSVPKGTPGWGAGWKKAAKDNYLHTTNVTTHGSVMSYRDAYLDLDPTYTDALGQPLLRMNFDWHDNDIKMNMYLQQQATKIIKAMQPKSVSLWGPRPGDHFDVRHYQSTHITGGVITGADPTTSALNRYLQSWDVSNLFVTGASAFPQNIGYNPTGLVGALTYFAVDAIKNQYLKNPGPLVPA